jgi:hypothetical protein
MFGGEDRHLFSGESAVLKIGRQAIDAACDVSQMEANGPEPVWRCPNLHPCQTFYGPPQIFASLLEREK